MKITVTADADLDPADLAEEFASAPADHQATFLNIAGKEFQRLTPMNRENQYCEICRLLDGQGKDMIRELYLWVDYFEDKS